MSKNQDPNGGEKLRKTGDESTSDGVTCSPSLESLKGLKGADYRNAWNKLHRERMREVGKAWRERNPKVVHQRSMARDGCSRSTVASRKSEGKATMAFERWGPVEDDILMSGKFTESELCEKLGRSIRAIQRRKWRLRQDDSLENK